MTSFEGVRKGTKSRTRLSQFADGRDENNLAEFPIALLSDSAALNQKTIEFEDTLKDWDTGQVIVRRVSITGSDKFGLPTAKDEEVLLALIQLTKLANDFSDPEVWFVKRDVIEILGWRNRGWAYDRVEESLHRWKGVSIHYWQAWRDKASGRWRDSAAVGVIDYFTLTDGRRKKTSANGGAVEQSRFCWNKLFFESFEAGYLKKLDFETYRSLNRPAAKRAYRFLDKRFWHKDVWEFDLRQFACEKLGFSRAYTTGQLKQRLRPALGELEEIGFIEPVSFRKSRPKMWTLSVAKKSDTVAPAAECPADRSPWASELVQRGVQKRSAGDLAQRFSEEYLAEKLAFFDWLMARGDKRVAKSPAGFLVSAIRDDYPPSKDFLAERKASKGNVGKPAAKRRAIRHGSSDDQAADVLSAEVEKYLASLSDAEQEAILARAVGQASHVEVTSLERLRTQGSGLYLAIRQSLLQKYVRDYVMPETSPRKVGNGAGGD
jgi:hypothetical protein